MAVRIAGIVSAMGGTACLPFGLAARARGESEDAVTTVFAVAACLLVMGLACLSR